MATKETYASEPECPACGYVMRDAWELNGGEEGETETECGGCEREIIVNRSVSVTYVTRMAAPKHGAGDDDGE